MTEALSTIARAYRSGLGDLEPAADGVRLHKCLHDLAGTDV